MYIYELHQHTSACSGCGAITPEELPYDLKREGYAGCVLTDHFFHGYTAIRRNIPWEDFVAAYEDGWRRAKAVGDQIGVDILFGIEEGVGDGKEVLLYGITPQFLYDHPELRDTPVDLEHLSQIVHEAGALLYQAHPFRVRDYIARPWEALPPMLSGLLVPWMPYWPHGTFSPRNLVPKPPNSPEKRLVMVYMPTGDGVSHAPVAMGHVFCASVP